MTYSDKHVLEELKRVRETMEKVHELKRYDQVNQEHIFTKLKLTRDEFDNLVFMGPPPAWERYLTPDQLPLKLCFKRLIDVVEELRKQTKGNSNDPCSVFEGLNGIKTPNVHGDDEDDPWFKSHLLLCQKFDKRLMPPLWIRNVSKWGNETKHGGGPFYTEDGNHRALVFAMRLACGKEEYGDGVSALHATSWDFAAGILGYEVHEASGLEHDGRLYPEIRDYVGGFGGPITIYERLK